jgi:hypothetical protein
VKHPRHHPGDIALDMNADIVGYRPDVIPPPAAATASAT